MSKKLVVKLIATVMAMTMVIGSGVTVFAASHDVAHILAYPDKGDGTHAIVCDDSECEEQGRERGTEAHSGGEVHQISATQHAKNCEKCSAQYDVADHAGGSLTPISSTRHAKMCGDCGALYDEADCTPVGSWKVTDCGTYHYKDCSECSNMVGNTEHTFGSDGKCTVCGYAKSGSSSSSSSSSTPAVNPAEEAAKVIEETVAKEEALPVTSFASTEAVKAIPAEAKASNGATYNISAVTTTQGFVAAVNKVAKASAATPTMAVYSSKPIAMNTTALNAVAKTGKTLVYTFSYKGHIYKVTIPAGAKVSTNGQMFMGPLAIGAQLGTTQIIK